MSGIVLGFLLIVLGVFFWPPLLWVVGGVATIVAVYNFLQLYRTYLGLWVEMRKDSGGRKD